MRSSLSVRTGIVSVVLAAASGTIACSSSTEDAAHSNDALVINPIGQEHESHLTLQLPTDACQPGASCAKILGQTATIYVDGAAVALGASTRLKPGSHTVAVNEVGWTLTTTPNQNLSVVLPVAHRVCSNESLPNVPKTDFGGSIAISNAACPTTAQGSTAGVPQGNSSLYWYEGCSYVAATPASSYECAYAISYYSYSYIDASGICVLGGYGTAGCYAAEAAATSTGTPGVAPLTDAYQVYVPGTLAANVNGVAQSLTLNAGDEADFDLDLPVIGAVPTTFETDLSFLDPRANPDAAQGTITSSCAGDATYTIPSATGTPAPIVLNAFTNTACTYTLNVGGRTQVLDQTATNAIGLHRLDVNEVTITREDGTTYTTQGTYSLNYGGVQVAGPYNTNTGIDVLSGTYEFSLSYTDFDGPQTQTQTITL